MCLDVHIDTNGKEAKVLYKVSHCTGHVSDNTKPHQLCWGDEEVGSAILYKESMQSMAGGYIVDAYPADWTITA